MVEAAYLVSLSPAVARWPLGGERVSLAWFLGSSDMCEQEID